MYEIDHLKWKSKFLCFQSLVLEVKGLKQVNIFKNRPFYSGFVLFNIFPRRSESSKKDKFSKKNSYLPIQKISGCNLNHTYFLFGLGILYLANLVNFTLFPLNCQTTSTRKKVVFFYLLKIEKKVCKQDVFIVTNPCNFANTMFDNVKLFF